MKQQHLSILCCFAAILLSAEGSYSQTRNISGTVQDSITLTPLEFANIALKRSNASTVSNEKGEFTLVLKEQIENDTLIINYVGYAQKKIPLAAVQKTVQIKLSPSSFLLNEVMITPYPPEHYILEALARIDYNYPEDPFETEGYYREKVIENTTVVNYTEAVFKSYYPYYLDTTSGQHQLLLYRKQDKGGGISFMKEEIEKNQRKEIKKAKRKGKTVNETDMPPIGSTLGGPENIFLADFVKYKDPYLDSNKLKKFNFSFGPQTTFQGKDLMQIKFESKGSVDYMESSGRILLDMKTLAIVDVEFRGVLVIPLFIKPMLLLYGIDIDNTVYSKNISYYEMNGRWYPEKIHLSLKSELTKRHFFEENEKGNFDIEQVFFVNKVNTADPTPVPVKKQFTPLKPIQDQVYNDKKVSWNDVSVLK